MRASLHWALGRALRFSIGTCVVALILATTLAGDEAERFATTAYLAAIFAAIALGVQRAFPISDEANEHAANVAPFPVFLAYAIGIVIVLAVLASLVSLPGVEAVAFVAGIALIGVTVLARSGAFAVLHTALVRGGPLVGISRYTLALSVLALAGAALIGGEASESLAKIAYRLAAIAAIFVAASLLAATPAGAAARAMVLRASDFLDRGTFVAPAVAAAAIVAASLLRAPFSEPFAVLAYAAAACAAFGLAMECRRLRS